MKKLNADEIREKVLDHPRGWDEGIIYALVDAINEANEPEPRPWQAGDRVVLRGVVMRDHADALCVSFGRRTTWNQDQVFPLDPKYGLELDRT